MSREAMQLALAALESDPISHAGLVSRKQAITALRQALVDADDTSQERVDEKAKREQKPVAWLKTWSDGSLSVLKTKSPSFADHELEPLYTVPPKREWVGLTADEIWKCNKAKSGSAVEFHICYEHQNLEDFAESVEAKLKEKNGG
jgi:hypothetical protein